MLTSVENRDKSSCNGYAICEWNANTGTCNDIGGGEELDCIDLSAFLENESNQQPEMIDLSIDLQEDLPVQSREVIVLH